MMKRHIFIWIFLCTIVAAIFNACGGGNNNPTVSALSTFTFTVGSKFQYKQWSVDSSGTSLESTLRYVHHAVIDSGHTVAGMSGVYFIADTSIDSATNKVVAVDTLYIATSGTIVYQYGFIHRLDSSLSQGLVNPPAHWDIVATSNSPGTWITDSTSAFTVKSIPAFELTNGINDGDTTFVINANPELSTHSILNGYIAAAGDTAYTHIDFYIGFSPAGSMRLHYAPVRIISPVGVIKYNGLERDCISFSN